MISRFALKAAPLLLLGFCLGCGSGASAPEDPVTPEEPAPQNSPSGSAAETDSPGVPAPERTEEEIQEARRLRDELHVALQQGDFEQAKKLVAAGADPNEPFDEKRGEHKGATLLHLVCNAFTRGRYQDRAAAARFLLENKADPNARNDHGWPPVAEAVWSGYLDLMKLLAEYDADLKVRIRGPWPNKIEDFTLLHVAALKSRPEPVEWLIEKDLDVNAVHGTGSTPLRLAYKKPAVLRVLLAHGADKDIKNDRGETALSLLQRDQRSYQEGTQPRADVDAAIELLKND